MTKPKFNGDFNKFIEDWLVYAHKMKREKYESLTIDISISLFGGAGKLVHVASVGGDNFLTDVKELKQYRSIKIKKYIQKLENENEALKEKMKTAIFPEEDPDDYLK